jgi:hypothetical protein
MKNAQRSSDNIDDQAQPGVHHSKLQPFQFHHQASWQDLPEIESVQ